MRSLQAHQIEASPDLMGELVRRPLPRGPVRATLLVLPSPRLEDLPGLGQRREPMRVQALVSERPVERLDVPAGGRLARPREVDLHPIPIRPQIQHLTGKFRTIVTEQPRRRTALLLDSLQHPHHVFTLQTLPRFDRQAFSRVHIRHNQCSKPSSVRLLIRYKIQTPHLIGCRRLDSFPLLHRHPSFPQHRFP